MANTALSVGTLAEDGEFWTEAIYDSDISDIEADSLQKTNNLNQLKADLFPGTYTYDSDGVGNLTNPLYNKQVASDTYSTDIALGVAADAGFVDVDAVNAALVFTPELTGNYAITFQFSEYFQSSAGNVMTMETYFRLQQGANNSNPIETGAKLASIVADQSHLIVPVTLTHIFSLTGGGAVTIKLQKYVVTATNVATHTLRGSAGFYELYMKAEKI